MIIYTHTNTCTDTHAYAHAYATPTTSLINMAVFLQSAGPDIRWVDSGRPLFRFDLGLVSTIYTKVRDSYIQTAVNMATEG